MGNPAHYKSCRCGDVKCTMPLEGIGAKWCWFLYEKGIRGANQSRFTVRNDEWYYDNRSTRVGASASSKAACDPLAKVCMGAEETPTMGWRGRQVDAVLEAIANGGIHPNATTTTSTAISTMTRDQSPGSNASTRTTLENLLPTTSSSPSSWKGSANSTNGTSASPRSWKGSANATIQHNLTTTTADPLTSNTSTTSTTTVLMGTTSASFISKPTTSDSSHAPAPPQESIVTTTSSLIETFSTQPNIKPQAYLNTTRKLIQSAEASATVDGDVVKRMVYTPDGAVHVAVQKMSSMNNSFSISAGMASTVLPAEVATRVAENKTMVVTVVHHSSAMYLAEDKVSSPASLGCKPVQIELLSLDQQGEMESVEVNNLQHPIQITIDIDKDSRPTFDAELLCVWWDAKSQQWSQSGLAGGVKLQLGEKTPSQIACNSSHLTSFSAMWRELKMALQCSNLHVLSSKAFQRYIMNREDQWFLHPAGLLYVLLVSSTIGLMMSAAKWDFKAHRRHHWRTSYFIQPSQSDAEGKADPAPTGATGRPTNQLGIADEASDALHGQPAIRLMGTAAVQGQPAIKLMADASTGSAPTTADKDIEKGEEVAGTNQANTDSTKLKIDVKQMAINAVLSYVVHGNIAAMQRIEACDIAVVAGKHVQRHGSHRARLHPVMQRHSSLSIVSTPTSTRSAASTSSTADRLAGSNLKKNFQTMVSRDFWSRTIALFRQKQPVAKLCSYSIVITHTLRAQLYCNELWSSLLMAALFFSTSATPVDDPEECSQRTIPFGRAMIVGLLSTTISCIIIVGFSNLHAREFFYENDEQKKAAILRKWKLMDAVLVTLSVAYTVFCAVFVGLFVAQVSHWDRTIFLISIIGSLCQSWLLQPLALAAALSWMTTVIAREQYLTKAMELILGVEDEKEVEKDDREDWHPMWHGTLLRQVMHTEKYHNQSPKQQHVHGHIGKALTLKIDNID